MEKRRLGDPERSEKPPKIKNSRKESNAGVPSSHIRTFLIHTHLPKSSTAKDHFTVGAGISPAHAPA